MSTIEGGMISTNDKKAYYDLLILRSHGLIREVNNLSYQSKIKKKYKDLNSQFIFKYPAYNLRNNEIGGILGQSQIKRLNKNIKKRNNNHLLFLKKLNKNVFFTQYNLKGHSNYALNLILKKKSKLLFKKLISNLKYNKIEYRIGSAGGGNQLRQPYLRDIYKNKYYLNFPNTEHLHFYSLYIGNYPELEKEQIEFLSNVCNSISE